MSFFSSSYSVIAYVMLSSKWILWANHGASTNDFFFQRKDVILDQTKWKRTKKVRVYADAVWSFQWFSVNILHFVCSKALTLPAEVWWLAKPFVPAEAPLVRHRAAHAASAAQLQNDRQPSHATVYIFCVSLSPSFYSIRVHVRMRVSCSQLTLVSFFF